MRSSRNCRNLSSISFMGPRPGSPRTRKPCTDCSAKCGESNVRRGNKGSSRVGAKRIGLSYPVEIIRGLGIAVQMMLGALVVRQCTVDRLYGVAGQRRRQFLRAIVQHAILQELAASVTS